MSDAFISYSRKDGEFTRRLNNELAKLGRDIWIDWEDIPRGTDFLNEIYEGIESADTFLFVVSRHSLTSEICNFELAHARKFNKRIIPLVRERLEGEIEKVIRARWDDRPWGQLANDNWNAITHINWLFFDTDDEIKFKDEFAILIKTLDTDLSHVKQHTRLLVQALEWQRRSQNPSFLLIGDEITSAETWLVASEYKHPPADSLHREFITTSRHNEDEREIRIAAMEHGVRISQRSALIATILVIFSIIGIGLAILSAVGATNAQQLAIDSANVSRTEVFYANEQVFHANATLTPIPLTLTRIGVTLQAGQTEIAIIPPTLTAVVQSIADAEARITSLEFAAKANEVSNPETAALLAIYGLNQAYTSRADAMLIKAVNNLYTRYRFVYHLETVTNAAFSPNGKFIVTTSTDNTARLLDFDPDSATFGQELQQFHGYNRDIYNVAFSPDGKFIVTGEQYGQTAHMWDANPTSVTFGQEVQQFNTGITAYYNLELSPDGNFLLARSALLWQLWDVNPNSPNFGQKQHEIISEDNPTECAVFHPDGKHVLIGNADGTVDMIKLHQRLGKK